MDGQAICIETCRWTDYESAGSAPEHIFSLQLYNDNLVRPTLLLLSERLSALERSIDVRDEFLRVDFATMYQATIEGYLLVVQSMWERGLRNLLIARANHRQSGPVVINRIKRAPWSDDKGSLHHYFEELLGLPFSAFYSYPDLDLLQTFGNAFRHGDGKSAEELHKRCPSLWSHYLPPDWHFAPEGLVACGHLIHSIKHPSIGHIQLLPEVLEQMIQSVVWFWKDIEYIRCRSISSPHPDLLTRLWRQSQERPLRAKYRTWSPG
jgi:hypothetical protein